MVIRRLVLLALGLFVVTTHVSGQATRSDNESVRRQLAAVMEKFTAAMKAGDARGISQLYTADANIAFNVEYRGPQIQSYWTVNVETYAWETVTYTPEELTVAGDTAFEWAVWSQTFRRKAGGEPVVQRLRSIFTWRRQADGSWKIQRTVLTVARLADK
jgi:ketosteroid isomerase-like protein